MRMMIGYGGDGDGSGSSDRSGAQDRRAEMREVVVRGKMMHGFRHTNGSLGAHKT